MDKKPQAPDAFANDPLFLEVMAEALAIQDRFSAEPVYAKTGKGYLKSAGVEELQILKKSRIQTNKAAGL
jgi:hypothetical protein